MKKILLKQLDIVKPDKETFDNISQTAKDFIKELTGKLKKKKISAEVFVGGSLAKSTLVKKDKYDVDIFVRFNEKYGDGEISKLLGSVLGKSAKKIHGSRDYYQKIINGIIIEIIPVIKIKKPNGAKNVMDLSYFHVKYVLGKIKKNKKLADQIILAKSFCHAQNCYGAESYIKGFSGYALELLIIHYNGFKNLITSISSNNKNGKRIIDMGKLYKNKSVVLKELNKSKLNSPIILIDPTFKERNALAGLSDETFNKFKKVGKAFLKNPSSEFFKEKDIGAELIKKYKGKLKIISVKTSKQPGDIAGTKSRKFLDFLVHKLNKEFEVNLVEFDYNEKKNLANFYFVLGKKSDEVIRGPFIDDKKNLKRFKQSHKKTIVKGKSVYAKIKHDLSFKEWFKLFGKKERKIIQEMSIKKIGLFKSLIKHKCKC
tara:strand:+ start:5137 stop:6423 length:1287 start_codon:yes stop_codon:yes gene_type:complete